MMTQTFWETIKKNSFKQNRPFFSLAPMEAVTDSIFRQVVARAAAPDVFFTEFTNALSITHPKAKFSVMGRLYVDPAEKTMPVVQLWGDQSEAFYKAAFAVKKMGYKAIDINTGCPDSTVVKNGGGSDLIRHPEKVSGIIAACRQSGLSVSVKTRLGFSKISEMNDWIPFLLEHKPELLTVHLRTRKEMSKVPAHYEVIDELIRMRDYISPETLLQINGDIKDHQQGMELYRSHPGLDGIMIGRGVFENPYCFSPNKEQHDLRELLSLFEMQLDLYDDYARKIGGKRFVTLRRFFKIYVRSMPNAAFYRDLLVNTASTDQARAIISRIRQRT